MNRVPHSIPELELWLREATRDLIPSAAASVREEITAHFEDSINNHITEGLAEPAAIELALRDLGSSKRANRRLRKEWLTEAELKSIEAMARKNGDFASVKGRFQLMLAVFAAIWLGILCYYFILLMSIGSYASEAAEPILAAGGPVSLVILAFYGIRCRLLSRSRQGFVALQVFDGAVLCVWQLIFIYPMFGTDFFDLRSRLGGFPAVASKANAIAYCAVAGWMVWIHFAAPLQIWLKFGRTMKRAENAILIFSNDPDSPMEN